MLQDKVERMVLDGVANAEDYYAGTLLLFYSSIFVHNSSLQDNGATTSRILP